MNAKAMAAILEHIDAKSVRICMLDEKLRKTDEMFRQWKTMLGFDAKMAGPEIEAAIKRMSFERTTLETNYKQHVELVNALATCPLPRDAAESNQAYALRVGEALKDAKLQWEHDQRRIAQLEKRESELNELQQIVETRDAQIAQLEEDASSLASALTLLGTMHDGELANEFVSRMADEKKRVTLQLDLIAKVIEQLPDSMRMQHGETYEPFLRRIQKSYVANEATIARHEATIESLNNRDAELLALYDVIENLRVLPMHPDEKYSEYLQRMAAEVDQLRTHLDAANRRLLNAQGENQLLTSQRQIVEGELSLHQQVIARLMMQPGTDKVFDLDWNASARKVLIDARAMCGDTTEANVVNKEPQ